MVQQQIENFGILCGQKNNIVNSFNHPTINGRVVYAFSDTPHLIKMIRNRLYTTSLQVILNTNS